MKIHLHYKKPGDSIWKDHCTTSIEADAASGTLGRDWAYKLTGEDKQLTFSEVLGHFSKRERPSAPPATAGNALLRKSYLEQIRTATLHAPLRLVIDLVAGLALLGLIVGTIVLFASRHPWLALYNLTAVALLYVLRNLAVLLVDVADMLAAQGAKNESGENRVLT